MKVLPLFKYYLSLQNLDSIHNILFVKIRIFIYNIGNDYEKYLNLIFEQLNYYKFILFYNESKYILKRD